jgi:hypothetical protein
MDERSLLFMGIVIVAVIGVLVRSSNRTATRTATHQRSRRSSLPPVRGSTTNVRSAKRRRASPAPDFTTASPDTATVTVAPLPIHPHRSKHIHPASSATASLEEQRLYRDLLTKARAPGTADRLIAYERARTPTGTRLDWLRDANERWERDNR